MGKRILFFSTGTYDPWGGSEELWSQTALDLLTSGIAVSASLPLWSPPHRRVVYMADRGIEIRFRPRPYSARQRAWRRLTNPDSSFENLELRRLLRAKFPDLVVFSDGGAFPPVDAMELCLARTVPFVTIAQANCEPWWPVDELAVRYRRAFSAAARCYFVSQANRRLLEKQIGCELFNSEVVRNPFNVKIDAPLAWPNSGSTEDWTLACVGRLDPVSKGQDLLFEALSGPAWAARRWTLILYGDGPKREGLERLARRLGLSRRVVFAGYVPPEEIWARAHVLVMPSRLEGLPLAVVEAMLSGRPVVATDVAGHAEVIEDGVTGFLADAPTRASIAAALERFWSRRTEAEAIGRAASRRIRQLVPPDPVRVFSGKIKEIMQTAGTCPERRGGG